MPNGHVKVFHADKNFGFIVGSDGNELYVAGDAVASGSLSSGDEVEFEISSADTSRPAATAVKITKSAPAKNPVGRTMTAPATWDELEERERQRRMARRRRR